MIPKQKELEGNHHVENSCAAVVRPADGYVSPWRNFPSGDSRCGGRRESPVYYSHDDRVTLIDGTCVETPIDSIESAAEVVFSVLDQLGGDERTDLEPWRELTNAFGNRYFVFQQMLDNTTVLGGSVKVITDRNGHMLGLTSSIVTGLPETQETEGVTAAHAEQIVLDHALETRQQA